LVNGWAKRLKPRTVKRQYGVLHAIFDYALNADFPARTPCRDIKVAQARPLQRRPPSADQLAALADELGPYGLMVWVGVITGLRWGEVTGLRVGSVDLLRGELKVVEQRTRDLEGDEVTAEPKSAAGVGTLSVPASLVAMVSEHLAGRGLTGADPDALIFVGLRSDGPLNYSN
jgi:integrase